MMKNTFSLICGLAVLFAGMLFTGCELPEKPESVRLGDSLTFSGYKWQINHSETAPRFPANNLFSRKAEDIYVDVEGNLHMKVSQHNGTWFATEVQSLDYFKYGTYSFTIAGDLKNIPENLVFRFFTTDPETFKTDMNSTLDIELNYRGFDTLVNPITYSVEPVFYDNGVQDYYYSERENRPDTESSELLVGKTTHTMIWEPNQIIWESYEGTPENKGEVISSWIFDDTKPGRIGLNGEGDDNTDFVKVPAPGEETSVTFQFWIETSLSPAPLDMQQREWIIQDFTYTPL